MRLMESFARTEADGKDKLIKVFNGGGIPSSEGVAKSFLEDVSKVSIYCRWLAASCFPDEHAKFKQEGKKKNPDSSLLSYFYHAVEDSVLSAIADYLLAQNPKHLSLHYDGVRVTRPEAGTTEELCDKLQEQVQQATGFRVVLREKLHRTVLEIMSEAGNCKEASVLAPDSILRASGNCIPAAVSLLLQRVSDVERAVVADGNCSRGQVVDPGAPTGPTTRSYRECEKLLAMKFLPCFPEQDSASTQWQPGNFVLHMENGGQPHCVGLHVANDLAVKVLDASNTFQIEASILDQAMQDGCDSHTCVLFSIARAAEQITPHACWEPQALEALLDLEAGASEAIEVLSDDECPESVASSVSDTEWVDGELCLDEDAQVLTDSNLLEGMKQEVAKVLANKGEQCFEQTRQGLRCPFCPWRCFRRSRCVAQHVHRRHTSKKQYCCSGTKQLKLILALHDTDVIAGFPKRDYLRKSAELLRQLLLCNIDTVVYHTTRARFLFVASLQGK